MTTFDIGVIIFLGASLIYSFFKGMVREIFSILGYVTGYFMALNFHETAAIYLRDFVPNEMFARMISFSLIFILASIVLKLLGKWVQNLMKSAGGLSGFDKVMGGVLGLAKGLFIVAIVMIPLEFFPDIYKKITGGSILSPYLKLCSSTLQQNMFSGEMQVKQPSGFGLRKKLPSNLKDAKEQMSLLEKLQNMQGDIKDKIGGLISPVGVPQDEYSEKSKKELENLLRSKLKK